MSWECDQVPSVFVKIGERIQLPARTGRPANTDFFFCLARLHSRNNYGLFSVSVSLDFYILYLTVTRCDGMCGLLQILATLTLEICSMLGRR